MPQFFLLLTIFYFIIELSTHSRNIWTYWNSIFFFTFVFLGYKYVVTQRSISLTPLQICLFLKHTTFIQL